MFRWTLNRTWKWKFARVFSPKEIRPCTAPIRPSTSMDNSRGTVTHWSGTDYISPSIADKTRIRPLPRPVSFLLRSSFLPLFSCPRPLCPIWLQQLQPALCCSSSKWTWPIYWRRPLVSFTLYPHENKALSECSGMCAQMVWRFPATSGKMKHDDWSTPFQGT